MCESGILSDCLRNHFVVNAQILAESLPWLPRDGKVVRKSLPQFMISQKFLEPRKNCCPLFLPEPGAYGMISANRVGSIFLTKGGAPCWWICISTPSIPTGPKPPRRSSGKGPDWDTASWRWRTTTPTRAGSLFPPPAGSRASFPSGGWSWTVSTAGWISTSWPTGMPPPPLWNGWPGGACRSCWT